MSEDRLDDQLNERFSHMESGLDLEAEWEALEARRRKRRRGGWWFWLGAGARLGSFLLASLALGLGVIQYLQSEPRFTERNVSAAPVAEVDIYQMDATVDQSPASLPETDLPPVPTDAAPTTIHSVSDAFPATKPTVGAREEERDIDEGAVLSGVPIPPGDLVPSNSEILQIEALPEADEDKTPEAGVRQTRTPESCSDPVVTIGYVPTLSSTPILVAANMPAPSRPAGSSRWTIGLETAYGAAFVDYKENRNPDFPGQFSLRAVDRLTYGLSIDYALGKRFHLRTGLYHFQHTQHLTGTWNRETSRMADNQLLEIRQLADGSTEEIYGSTAVDVRETVNYSLWERHQAWVVPLEVGYTVWDKQALELRIYGGVGVSFGYRHSGHRPFVNKSYPFFYPNRKSFFLWGWPGEIAGQWRLSTDLRYALTPWLSLGSALTAGGDLGRHGSYPTVFASDRYGWLQLQVGLYFSL